MPWMPTPTELAWLRRVPGFSRQVQRLARRSFAPLLPAPKIQGRFGEYRRLWRRWRGTGDEGLSYEANDWLMNTMARACRRKSVSAVHSYEDCSLSQFREAKRLGKACIYDMPIGYYPAWEQTQAELVRKFADWLPAGGLPSSQWVRPEQKRHEMELADLVLAPSRFVSETILRFHPDKSIAPAPYGVALDFWRPSMLNPQPSTLSGPLRFIYAGQSSLRKGIPVLLEAWRRAGLKDATLELVGLWQFAETKRRGLPQAVILNGPVSAETLREKYQASDVFVFPSFFEGFSLALLEAMACGLPAIATDATAGMDLLDEDTGKVIPAGDVDSLIESLRWFAQNRDRLTAMQSAARSKVEQCTWANYRSAVSKAVAPFS